MQILAIFAVLGFANAGLINSVVAPIGVRTIATGISPIESTVVAGPSGTIVDSRNSWGLAHGAGLLHGGIAAPVVAARTVGWNGLGWNGLNAGHGWNAGHSWNTGLVRSGVWAGAPWGGAYGGHWW